MKNTTQITCKTATYLLSKKQEVRLSLKETVQLKLHVAVCSVCAMYKTQINFITTLTKKTPKQTKQLTDTAKAKMATTLQTEIENTKQ